MAKQILKGLESRNKIKKGMDELTDIVKVTLGPKGRNIVIEKEFGEADVIQDGVTVARSIDLKNRFENIGANLVKSVAVKTNDEAGDGTTTAIILAHEMVSQGMKYAELGVSALGIRGGMKSAINALVEEIKKNSVKVSERAQTEQIATISAKNKHIGKIVADVMDKVGKAGVVNVEKSPTNKIEQELVEGFRFNKGYISPYMINNPEKQVAEFEDVFILITDKAISDTQKILPILEKVAQAGQKQLVIIAGDMGGHALTTLVFNNIRNLYKTVMVKAPEYGEKQKEALSDIAILTGGSLVSADTGLELDKLEIQHLGAAKKVIVTKEDTTIIQGAGDQKDVEARIKALKKREENSKSDFDKEKLRERLGRLSGVVGMIKVGANSETEQKELELRVEDALSATQSALEEGIVSGGGLALIRAAEEEKKTKLHFTEEELKGWNIVMSAIYKPFNQILINAGQKPDIILNDILNHPDKTTGFNADKGKLCDMIKEGIIDPTKVVRSALENAGSIAEMFLSTEAVVCFEDEDAKKV